MFTTCLQSIAVTSAADDSQDTYKAADDSSQAEEQPSEQAAADKTADDSSQTDIDIQIRFIQCMQTMMWC